MSSFIDITGQKFGKWTAVDYYNRDNRTYWRCICECGYKGDIPGHSLRTGRSKMCRRCSSCRVSREYVMTHGDSISKTYRTWQGIMVRCGNKNNKSYPWYGGIGIKMAPEWEKDYSKFRDAVGEPPSSLSVIDRHDLAGDFAPGNVFWTTRGEQKVRHRAFRESYGKEKGVGNGESSE